MPICNKPSQAAVNMIAATDVNDHASEAAKMKRTREQAYFNSYDFDAIEVLPYDDDEIVLEEHRNSNWAQATLKSTMKYGQHPTALLKGAMSLSRQRHQATATATTPTLPPATTTTTIKNHHPSLSAIGTTSVNSSATPSVSGSSRSSSASRDGRYSNDESGGGGGGGDMMLMKYSYLQRLGEFLIKKHHEPRGIAGDSAPPATAVNGPEPIVGGELVNGHELEHVDGDGNGNFLLPRPMLKYQSVGVANSMPVGPSAVCAITPVPPTPPPLPSPTTAAATLPLAIGQGNRQLLGANTVNNGPNNNATTTTTDDHKTAVTRMMMMTSGNNNSNNNNGGNNNKKIITMNGNGALRAQPPLPSTTSPYQDGLVAQAQTTTTTTATGVLGKKKLSTSSTLTTTTTASSSSTSASEANVNIKPNNDSKSKGKATSIASLIPGGDGDVVIVDCEPTPRGRTGSHQSHYSTDKSGSSGYYSSNVCSTYSLEDHIYCEPHIDVLEVNTPMGGKSNNNHNQKTMTKSSQARRLQQLTNLSPPQIEMDQQVTLKLPASRKRDMTSGGNGGQASKQRQVSAAEDNDADGDDDDDDGIVIGGAAKGRAQSGNLSPVLFNDQLRVLETSIENLDRHLKNFPGALGAAQDHVVAFVQTAYHHPPHLIGPYHHLPTIMEGLDQQQQQVQSQQRSVGPNQPWRPDPDTVPDDSLMDIDLDSFLLVNERQKYPTKQQTKNLKSSAVDRGGIDNPTFLTDEQEENHYKCAKYINSCPEDAYRVESDIGAPGTSNGSVKSSTIDHYLKRYEDQMHFQSTRELLEDVRDKIRLLAHNSNANNYSHTLAEPNKAVPRELQGMIKTLQTELETYLERMNRHSELEIRQLYSGMVKNHNVVKMKKAFERRRSLAMPNVGDCDFAAYEAIQDGILMTSSGVPLSIRQQVTSIRCASDPNFKMKRKSLAEIFPHTDCYVETSEREATNAPTQLQRNLSFHKPVLNKFDSQVAGPNGGGADIGSGGGGVESGSNDGGSAEKDSVNEWHSKKPSIWEMYYGTNRLSQSLLGKRSGMVLNPTSQGTMSYPSSRPESDFTLDLPRAEQLRIKMEKEKKFRQRCRYITTFLSLVFFLLTVMVVSLVLTRGKRMFGSMI